MSDSTEKKAMVPNNQNRTVQEPLAVNEHKAARIQDKSVQSLRNERYLGKGCPYIKIGKSVRYLMSDLIDYLNKNRIDPERAE